MLEGPAGTGKTLVALQVADNLLECAKETSKGMREEPLLVITAHYMQGDDPIMKYLASKTKMTPGKVLMGWWDILSEVDVPLSTREDEVLPLLS